MHRFRTPRDFPGRVDRKELRLAVLAGHEVDALAPQAQVDVRAVADTVGEHLGGERRAQVVGQADRADRLAGSDRRGIASRALATKFSSARVRRPKLTSFSGSVKGISLSSGGRISATFVFGPLPAAIALFRQSESE